MLLRTLQHLEAALRRRAVRHCHQLVGLRLRDALHELRPLLAFGAEQIDDLGLRIRQLLVNGRLLQESAEELEVLDGRDALAAVNVVVELRGGCDVQKGLRHRTAVRRDSIAIALFRDVLGHEDGVLAHSAQGTGQLLGSIGVHDASFVHLRIASSLSWIAC